MKLSIYVEVTGKDEEGAKFLAEKSMDLVRGAHSNRT